MNISGIFNQNYFERRVVSELAVRLIRFKPSSEPHTTLLEMAIYNFRAQENRSAQLCAFGFNIVAQRLRDVVSFCPSCTVLHIVCTEMRLFCRANYPLVSYIHQSSAQFSIPFSHQPSQKIKLAALEPPQQLALRANQSSCAKEKHFIYGTKPGK